MKSSSPTRNTLSNVEKRDSSPRRTGSPLRHTYTISGTKTKYDSGVKTADSLQAERKYKQAKEDITSKIHQNEKTKVKGIG